MRKCNSFGLPERGGRVFPSEANTELQLGRKFELFRTIESGWLLVSLERGGFGLIPPDATSSAAEMIEE
jgi:hypothetical protein